MATSGETVGLRGNTPAYEYVTAKKPVISAGAATRTLVDSEAGSVVLLDRVAGNKFTLPVGVPGQEFTFISNMTSLTYAIVTNIGTSTPIIVGGLGIFTNGITGSMFISTAADLNCQIKMNGTTTGGIQGSKIVLTNVSSGTWFVSGTLIGSGTFATPFTTASV